MMEHLENFAIALLAMLPFIAVYYFGVAVRIGRENKTRTVKDMRRLDIQLIGEAFPGLFESIVTLAAIFGVVFQSQSATQRFQILGILASAAFLSFRGGYTYQESLLAMRHSPPTIPSDQAARAE